MHLTIEVRFWYVYQTKFMTHDQLRGSPTEQKMDEQGSTMDFATVEERCVMQPKPLGLQMEYQSDLGNLLSFLNLN